MPKREIAPDAVTELRTSTGSGEDAEATQLRPTAEPVKKSRTVQILAAVVAVLTVAAVALGVYVSRSGGGAVPAAVTSSTTTVPAAPTVTVSVTPSTTTTTTVPVTTTTSAVPVTTTVVARTFPRSLQGPVRERRSEMPSAEGVYRQLEAGGFGYLDDIDGQNLFNSVALGACKSYNSGSKYTGQAVIRNYGYTAAESATIMEAAVDNGVCTGW